MCGAMFISPSIWMFSIRPSCPQPEHRSRAAFTGVMFCNCCVWFHGQCNIRGFDVVELAPLPGVVAPDFMAAKLIYRLMGYMTK